MGRVYFCFLLQNQFKNYFVGCNYLALGVVIEKNSSVINNTIFGIVSGVIKLHCSNGQADLQNSNSIW